MNKYKYSGSCHCGNITFEMAVPQKLNLYNPRACDCNFCLKHRASYISDEKGKLAISVKKKSKLNRYQHGDRIADFLICQTCGVLVGVCYETQEHLYATINICTLEPTINFKQNQVVSPKKFGKNEKIQRWKDLWFANVALITN
ncbi:MAG: hypothetical protein RLZZ381_2849 [Cyanobacteriota bacterium]|jgi:hypothetical protein